MNQESYLSTKTASWLPLCHTSQSNWAVAAEEIINSYSWDKQSHLVSYLKWTKEKSEPSFSEAQSTNTEGQLVAVCHSTPAWACGTSITSIPSQELCRLWQQSHSSQLAHICYLSELETQFCSSQRFPLQGVVTQASSQHSSFILQTTLLVYSGVHLERDGKNKCRIYLVKLMATVREYWRQNLADHFSPLQTMQHTTIKRSLVSDITWTMENSNPKQNRHSVALIFSLQKTYHLR